MGICFGRSSKNKLQAHQSCTSKHPNEKEIRRPQHLSSNRLNWYYVEQRSNISNGYLPPSNSAPQGWIIAPVNPSPRYNSYLAMSQPLPPPLPPPRPQSNSRTGNAMKKMRSVTNLLTPDVTYSTMAPPVPHSNSRTGNAMRKMRSATNLLTPDVAYPTMPPPAPQNDPRSGNTMRKMRSVSNLLAGDVPSYVPGASYINNSVQALSQQGAHHLQQSAALYDLISSKLCSVVTLIDEDKFSGDVRELAVYQEQPLEWQPEQQVEITSKDLGGRKGKTKVTVKEVHSESTYTNYFSRVNDYANSRLPMNLPAMKLYMSTYPLICLAAQFSDEVYEKPKGQERESRVNAGGRKGTVMKSTPIDDRDVIVFAIRGTQTFMDWTVNVRTKPKSPEGFLDDTGNLCHAGFLTVARSWIKPIAARLRHLLQENPNRTRSQLLITGHSAGGAVAALLYSHMLSTTPEARSELNILTAYFKRVHCVTFGAPPVSLLPLQTPNNPLASKSVFFSFINEGDLVARADFAYVKSLLDLLSTPAPGKSYLPSVPGLRSKKSSHALAKKSKSQALAAFGPVWDVPEAELSNAGKLVLLRGVENSGSKPGRKLEDRMDDGVIAQMISDDLLRGVVWGDPVCHMMKLYTRRILILATNAVTGRA